MRLRDVMHTKVETVTPRESGAVAFERMRRAKIRHLVVQDGRKIVGVLSDRDLAAMGSLRQVETVEDVMTSPAITGSPDLTLRQAANLLRGRTMGCLPILEDGKIVGIVTTTDLLELIGRGVERPVPKTRRWILKDRGPRRRAVTGRGRTVRVSGPRS
ncbi:MAG TPA: CBS domain-containing protein [Thermoanaerobaculia bacterium]|nr:CBS domain-containing protein [Thermoanaerobaculia bacterium]